MNFHNLNNISIYQAEGQSPFLLSLSLLTVVAVFLTYLLRKFGAHSFLLCVS